MNTLISKGGYGSPAISSIGKLRVSDVDGPASLNNNFTGVGSIGLPSAVSVAATFNKELAHSFGDAIGTMAHDMQVSGWYAPATNTHRYGYAGRNFEYFSERSTTSARVRGCKLGAAQQRPARRVGLPRYGPHRLLRGHGIPERRPDHA